MVADFASRGWAQFPAEAATRDWVAHALPAARLALDDPANSGMFQCGGTWFVGLDALPNDVQGRVAGSDVVRGAAVDFARAHLGGWPNLHRAQVSVTFPGYPKPRDGEGEAAFGYRQRRDAAHVDGVIGRGAPKRRYVQEPHAFVLGIGLTGGDSGAAPLVVYEGSHLVMRAAFRARLNGAAPAAMEQIDVTEDYVAARRRCFEECARVPLALRPGETVVLHPMLLHGVAPWTSGAAAPRMTAYFRPPMPGGVSAWQQAG